MQEGRRCVRVLIHVDARQLLATCHDLIQDLIDAVCLEDGLLVLHLRKRGTRARRHHAAT